MVVICFGDIDPNKTTKFRDMYDCIHVDEKWFYLTHDRHQFLLVDDDLSPQYCVCHKDHITKAMFLCAVGCPCYNTRRKSWWDGNLGVWPVGSWEKVK